MKRFDLGQTVNTLANIGVITGIVFLALQMSQFQSQMEAQTAFNYYSAVSGQLFQVSTSPYLSDVLAKLDSGDALTEGESVSADLFIVGAITGWEYAWREKQAGRFDDAQFSREIISDFRQALEGPAGPRWREVWLQEAPERDPNFVARMEAGIEIR